MSKPVSSQLIKRLFAPTTLAISLALVGCGGSGDNKTASASGTAASAKIDPSQLADKQELVINNTADPVSLDPHKIDGVVEGNIVRQMFEGLVQTDDEGKTIPGMAEKWESPDNKVWTFHLRDAKWSNGDPVTADDFVYSFQRLADPKTASPYASYLEDAKVVNATDVLSGKMKPTDLGVKAIDAKTFQVTLSDGVPYFADMLALFVMSPVHKASVEKFGDKWTDPANIVVNGAYKLNNWAVNEKIVLDRNKTYYDDAKTHINKVTFLALTDGTADLARYRTGEIDISAGTFPTEQFNEIKNEMGSELNIAPALCTFYFGFNTEKAPFNDVRVRKALALTLDREVVTDKILGQGQAPAYQFTPVSTAHIGKFEPEWKAWDKSKRIEEAKKLLTEAGYSAEKPATFELLYNTDETNKKLAVAVTEMWKQSLGGMVNGTLKNQEWKTYLATRKKGDYQAMRARWCGDYNEPSTFLNLLRSNSSYNDLRYKSKEFDSLMDQTLAPGVDTAKRSELYAQAEAQAEKDMPMIPVFTFVGVHLNKPYVLGVSHKDPLGYYQVKKYSIAKH
ncbi:MULTISPECIES: ABC transporter substrate-binding protein [unclassified Acinetobacter]|uniref:ABC transporter substrate-binding protein n=1 Tax=unclassified Acinetobacter TaxID=196816 RepID=UPI0035B941EB